MSYLHFPREFALESVEKMAILERSPIPVVQEEELLDAWRDLNVPLLHPVLHLLSLYLKE